MGKLSILVGSTCECGLHFENQIDGTRNVVSARFDLKKRMMKYGTTW